MDDHDMDAANSSQDDFSAILPPEIVDHIFRYACILSTSFCLALCESSSWTRKLAIPYLYSTIVVTKLRKAMTLSAALGLQLVNSPIPNFVPKAHVRSIWIEPVSNMTLHIFRTCDVLLNLAITEDNLNWIIHSSSPATARLSILQERTITRKQDLHLLLIDAKRRYWSQAMLASSANPSPFFTKVTHLRLGKMGSYSTHLNIAHFTRLSHIAVPFHRPQDQCLDDLLELFDLPSVMVVVVVILIDLLSEEDLDESLRWIVEHRAVKRSAYCVLSRSQDLRKEWEEEARNGMNIWDRAVRCTESLAQEAPYF
ncbi:hypothetical protein HYPSUDRAFT_45501 [Hypholoma sublateritium FD-334 SS-4]|uniref:F-box domain-containing protein n=1 Tax=Hypholoma sublateritium (strain FD-334 SS-4) TaxID=945553 RepID=A0A0D2M4X8_HYPSF|nr:hypothetical protein HYPSUDRAFT_45501 [Hypholoma sublateritium FD-334 SS-4]